MCSMVWVPEDHGELRSLAHVTTSSLLPEVGTDLGIWKEDQTALGLEGPGHSGNRT